MTTLIWQDYNAELLFGFYESLCRGDFVDVKLAAEGQIVEAHRLVLTVCSPYFKEMLAQMPADTGK